MRDVLIALLTGLVVALGVLALDQQQRLFNLEIKIEKLTTENVMMNFFFDKGENNGRE